MAENWLVERLTENKKSSPRWVELAEALEEYWDTHFFDDLQKFEDSHNIFTASPEDLDKRIAELGDFFDVALPIDESSKRLGVLWRKEEVHQKDTALLVESLLTRNFNGSPAKWERVWAPNGAYDALHLYSTFELDILNKNKDDYWLTSRGKLLVDLGHLHRIGMIKSEFVAIARREIERVRPTHIVYDGEVFLLTIDFYYSKLEFVSPRITAPSIGARYRYSLVDHFDDQAADVLPLDLSPVGVDHYRGQTSSVSQYELGGMPWSLDLFVDLGDRLVPVPGVEGDILPPLGCFSTLVGSYDLDCEPSSLSALHITVSYSVDISFPSLLVAAPKTKANTYSAGDYLLGGMPWSLDLTLPSLSGDEVFVPGVEGDQLPPMAQVNKQISKTPLPFIGNKLTNVKEHQHQVVIPVAPQRMVASKIQSETSTELAQKTKVNINPWLGFDEMPSDFIPLDTPLWETT